MTDLSQLTAIGSTSDRPKSLHRLVRSVRRHFPQLKVIVADHSQSSRPRAGVDTISLPVGVGLSAGWNALLARVRTRYFLLLDDRCQLCRDTDVDRLLQLVVDDRLDIAAGDLVGCRRRFRLFVSRRPQPGHGLLDFNGQDVTLTRGHRSAGDGYLWCDLVANFFVARTDKVRALGGWDPELMNDAREEFFVRCQRHGLRVGIAPEVTASLWNEAAEVVATEASRDCKSLAVAKMGLTRMTDFDGRVIKAPRRARAA